MNTADKEPKNAGLVAAVVVETVLLSVILIAAVCLVTKFRNKWQGWSRLLNNNEELRDV